MDDGRAVLGNTGGWGKQKGYQKALDTNSGTIGLHTRTGRKKNNDMVVPAFDKQYGDLVTRVVLYYMLLFAGYRLYS